MGDLEQPEGFRILFANSFSINSNFKSNEIKFISHDQVVVMVVSNIYQKAIPAELGQYKLG